MELSLELRQKQVLSPQMQQSVELLQMNLLAFSEYVKDAAEENPLLEWEEEDQEKETLLQMEKSLPVLFIAGGDDPVGAYGKGVQKTAQCFRNAGMQRVTLKIYPMGRHEILNEINRAEVYEDIRNWMEKQIEKLN